MHARLLSYCLLLSLLAGCAPASPQLRTSRVLVALGAAAMVVGVLVASGCEQSETSGCSGGPDSAEPEQGAAVMAAGAALIGAGMLTKPKEKSRLFVQPAPRPIPMLPDPFVPTLPPNPP